MPTQERPTGGQPFDAISQGYTRASIRPALHNRVRTLMIHTSRYAFQGQARLAADVQVSRSTISRMLRGETCPSYRLVQAVTSALSAHLKRRLEPQDLFSTDGTYPEPSGCTLAGCSGCMPDAAYNSSGDLRPEWQNARPGEWSRSPGMPEADSQ